MIFFSLHPSKYLGSCYYKSQTASLFVCTMMEDAIESNEPTDFLRHIFYVEIHEALHLLLKKLGIKGNYSERCIQKLTDEIGDSLISKELVEELADLYSDVLERIQK
jgi:hypothetical protein